MDIERLPEPPYVAAVDSYIPLYVLGYADDLAYERLTDGSLRRVPGLLAVELHRKAVGRPSRPAPVLPRQSTLDHIRHAKTAEEIHTNLLRLLAEVPASAKTKRKWRAAAERRIAELRVQIVKEVSLA